MSLRQWEVDLSPLTDAEEEAYRQCRIRGRSVRAFARATDRAPGTVGNLLARAERKVETPG